jgi:hypothetical protein
MWSEQTGGTLQLKRRRAGLSKFESPPEIERNKNGEAKEGKELGRVEETLKEENRESEKNRGYK